MAFLATNVFDADGDKTYWDFSFAGVSPDTASGTQPYLDATDVKAAELYTDAQGNAQYVQRSVIIDPSMPTRAHIAGAPVARGRQIKIFRRTEIRYPLVDYRDLQTVSETDLDLANRQAIFLAQELRDSEANGIVVDDSDNYDANGRRIVNLAPGTRDRDAVNVAQLRNSIEHTVRVSPDEATIPELPSPDQRSGRLLGFDSAGKPVTVAPITGSATDLAIQLASSSGGGMIGYGGYTVASFLDALQAAGGSSLVGHNGQSLAAYLLAAAADFANATDPLKGVSMVGAACRTVDSVAAISALPSGSSTTALALGYYKPGDSGGGVYRRIANSSAVVDGGRVLATNDGVGRWHLCQSTPATLRQYGAKGDNLTDDTDALLRAVSSKLPLLATEGKYRVAPIGPAVSYPNGREPNRTSGAVLSSGQSITGAGAGVTEFIWSSTTTVQAFFKADDAHNIVISGITFTGGYAAIAVDPKSNNSVTNVGLSDCVLDGQLLGIIGGRQYALDPTGSRASRNLWLDRCVIKNTTVHGVMITNCDHPRVTNCEFLNLTGGYAIDFSQGCRGGIVANNTGTGMKYFFKAESSNVDPNGGTLNTDPDVVRSDTIIVSGNVMTGIEEHAVLLNSGVQRFVISGNNLSGSFTRAIWFGQVTGSAGPGLSMVVNNVLTCASTNAIAFFSQSSTGSEPILISNNEVTGGSTGLWWETGRLRFLDNNINVIDLAIQLNATADGVDIIDNFLKARASIVSSSTGIWKRVCINGNRMHGTSGITVYLGTIGGFQNGEFYNNKIFRTGADASVLVMIRKVESSRVQDNTFNVPTGGNAMHLLTATLTSIVSGNISTRPLLIEGSDSVTTSNTINNITTAAYVA